MDRPSPGGVDDGEDFLLAGPWTEGVPSIVWEVRWTLSGCDSETAGLGFGGKLHLDFMWKSWVKPILPSEKSSPHQLEISYGTTLYCRTRLIFRASAELFVQ